MARFIEITKRKLNLHVQTNLKTVISALDYYLPKKDLDLNRLVQQSILELNQPLYFCSKCQYTQGEAGFCSRCRH